MARKAEAEDACSVVLAASSPTAGTACPPAKPMPCSSRAATSACAPLDGCARHGRGRRGRGRAGGCWLALAHAAGAALAAPARETKR